jgi:hypothetical protein
MKTLIVFLIVSWAYLPLNHVAGSSMRCFSEPRSVKTALKRSTAVFSGEVVEIYSGAYFLQARFRVERSWKGVEVEEVVVFTDGSAESPHYKVGEKYLVFAGFQNEKLFTGLCSRTKKIEYAAEDLKQLGEGKLKSKND